MFASLVPNVTPVLAAAAAGGAPNSLINLVPLIPAIPLAGFVFTALFGRRIGRAAFVLPLLAVTATWLLSMAVVYQALTGGFGEHGAGVTLWRWIPAGAFTVEQQIEAGLAGMAGPTNAQPKPVGLTRVRLPVTATASGGTPAPIAAPTPPTVSSPR